MIGIFDSGLGGLSVAAAVARALPRADIVYFADTAHLPYGNKADAFIAARVLTIGAYLARHGCTALVVACNTATAAAVLHLREQHPDIPVVGVEPGVKPAASSSITRRIAVLATESTANSERLRKLVQLHARDVHVHIEACPGWATRVETLQSLQEDDSFSLEVAAKLTPLLAAGADRIVLGCTHYSFLRPLLAPLVAGQAELVEVAEAVARQVVRLVGDSPLGHGALALLTNAAPLRLQRALPHLDLAWLAERQKVEARQIEL